MLTQFVCNELAALNQRYDFIILDLDHELSKQAAGAHNFMRALMNNFRTALYNLERNGVIIIKMHGIPDSADRFMAPLKLYFEDIRHLQWKIEHLKHRENKHTSYVMCSGFCKERALPEPKSTQVQPKF